ncbi:hypothetical protein BC941DRAFT_413936 [Chlamydoabsidia padenii]|nr:hypothetical protein BC941DRAFT_413936 [Chlamydoabsidia padenii]
MRYVSSKSTREAMIEALEMKNEELNEHLDAILQEQASMDKSNTKKHRQLEQEINRLNTSLEMATTKIQELEDMNKKTKGRRPPPPDDNVDRHMIDDLLDQIDQLKTQNDTTIQSKQDLETKLANTLQDLRRLREQFEQFQFTKDDHEDLKAAYERQFRHIDELNASVEEHRSMLQKLQERGVPDEPKNTLFGEGMKQRPHHLQPSYSTPTHHAPSPVPCMKPSLSSTTLLSDLAGTTDMRLVLARAAGVDQKTLEDAIRFVDCLEGGEPSWEEDQQWMTMFDPAFPRDGLYPALATSNSNSNKELMVYPTTLNGRIQNTVRHFFKAVWRWCRFAAILTTAILISLWNGPDYMLLENY